MSSTTLMREYEAARRYAHRPPAFTLPASSSRSYYDYSSATAPPASSRDRYSAQGYHELERPRKLPKYDPLHSHHHPPSPRGPAAHSSHLSNAVPATYRYADGQYRQSRAAAPSTQHTSTSSVHGSSQSHRQDYRSSLEFAGGKQVPGYMHSARATHTTPHIPSNGISGSHQQRAVQPEMSGHATLPARESTPGSSEATRASTKRPVLVCTVCGPDACGPWRRGPIGPYTLCDSCAKIEWQEEDGSLPTTVHEALSLLDNMRLIRLSSVLRKLGERGQAEVARRLQNGLPDTTYTRTEEFFERKAAAEAKSEKQIANSAGSITALPETLRSAPTGSVSDNKVAGESSSASRALKATEIGTITSTAPRKRPFDSILNDTEGPLPSGSKPDTMSPNTLAVAALMCQPVDPKQSQLVQRGPLTPVNTDGNNRAFSTAEKDIAVVNSNIPTALPTPKKTASPLASAVLARKKLKTFPFRDSSSLNASPAARIIDRRRARNEALRQKYLQRRAEQQRAQEAKAAKIERVVSPAVNEEKSGAASGTSAPAVEKADEATSQVQNVEEAVETSPATVTSTKSAVETPDLADPPASLRDLAEASSVAA